MPPKAFKKVPISSLIKLQQQPQVIKAKSDSLQNYINPEHLISNIQVLGKMRLFIAVLIGSICGIINLNQIIALIVYFTIQLAVTPIITLKMKNYLEYFNNKSQLISGMTQSILMFVCSWMIVYNLVYTL